MRKPLNKRFKSRRRNDGALWLGAHRDARPDNQYPHLAPHPRPQIVLLHDRIRREVIAQYQRMQRGRYVWLPWLRALIDQPQPREVPA
jgi:hypothetical protein